MFASSLDLTVLRLLLASYILPGDQRLLGSAGCNGCCPIATLVRRSVNIHTLTFVEYTRYGDHILPHDANVQLLVRLIDTRRKGAPIGVGTFRDLLEAVWHCDLTRTQR